MARKKTKSGFPFKHVEEITPEHAAVFLRAFRKRLGEHGTLDEALNDTEIMAWPYGPSDQGAESTEEQDRFLAAQDEIEDRLLIHAAPALARAFTAAASVVLGARRPSVEPLADDEISLIESLTAGNMVVRHVKTGDAYWRDPLTGELMQGRCVDFSPREEAMP